MTYGRQIRETATSSAQELRAAIRRMPTRSRDPSNGSMRLTRADTKRGKEGGPLTQQHTLPVHSQGREGDTPTRLRALLEFSKDVDEGGVSPTWQRVITARSLGIGGESPTG